MSGVHVCVQIRVYLSSQLLTKIKPIKNDKFDYLKVSDSLMTFFYVVITIIFMISLPTNITNDEETEWKEAKRELARKTREYLRQNPPSPELIRFIESIRKNNRKKRQDHNNMYAIKDGEVVPLDKIEQELNNADNNLGENFTVVPLLIPIPLENNVTLKHRYTTEDNYEVKTNRYGKVRDDTTSKEEQRSPSTEETVIDSLIEKKLKSTTDAAQLNKVLEDVENLINSQKKGRSPNEGALCNVVGYWDSRASGMNFHIKKTDSGDEITAVRSEPAVEDGFMIGEHWNVTAQIPFEQKAQVIISAVSRECRICEGGETITGDWIVSRPSSGCKDQKASHAFFADIMRKNNIETLREDHLKKCTKDEINLSTTDRF
ncbi:uncharacterized protein LOC143198755 isoform X2 [Rhynchophorus ferrugineus]|uniref:uncharacterized protein LOC143198755 isoform X2 n=1 Tax=Rhynchophorus ferrugineus TaxID=354439 RepID=UPI003FCEB471